MFYTKILQNDNIFKKIEYFISFLFIPIFYIKQMGSRCMTSKKASSIPVRTTEQQDNYVRGKTVAAEEIMRKSVWFIEKEEFDNYFSKEELRYYRKMQETSKKITEMQILMVPAEMR